MYTSNNKVLTKLPQLISTIGDIPEETKTVYTPYGNKYLILNLGYQFSNPLVLPLNLTVDFIVYGNISLSANVVKSETFQIVTEYGNKFSITGEGTVLVWYRYGQIDPASFNLIMQYALEQNDYVLVDALLHTLSIQEAISYVLQNPLTQEMILKGMDWQLNKIGFKDFLAYINGGRYDIRHLALFLTIASYLFPCVFEETSIPQFSGKPLQVYLQYLFYLSEYGQVVTSKLEELSEQSVYHQAEIDVLFNQSSELSEITAYHQSEIEELFTQTAYLSEQSTYHQSEIEELFAETAYLSEQSVYHQSEIEELFTQTTSLSEQTAYQQSEIETLFSEVSELSEQVENLSVEVSVLFVEDYIINSEIANLSEELVSEQSEITALSEFTSECCDNVLIQLGKALTDLLKITAVLYQLVNAVGSESGLNVSELDNILSETAGDISQSLQDLIGLLNFILPNSPITSELQQDVSETLSQVGNLLGNLLGGLLGNLGGLLGGLLGNLASVKVSESSPFGGFNFKSRI